MDKDTARRIATCMHGCVDLLSQIVEIAHANCGEYEDKIVRRGVGHVLSELQDRLGDPMYREHPDLIPQDVEYAPLEGPTLGELARSLEQTEARNEGEQ